MHIVSGLFVGLGALIALGDALPPSVSLTGLSRAAAEASQNLPDQVPTLGNSIMKLSSVSLDSLPNLFEKFRVTSEMQSRLTNLHSRFAAHNGKQKGRLM
jgi:hypothetical protein